MHTKNETERIYNTTTPYIQGLAQTPLQNFSNSLSET